METPIYTKLDGYYRKNRIPFAMPGHKNGRGLAANFIKYDVTELDATVDLHDECDEVRRANELLAGLYRADESFIMTGGSTLGVQVMITSSLSPGDTLLAGADCHMSVINTCAVCGFRLRLIPVQYDEEFGVPGRIEDFDITPDVKAVLLTSPNYYGITKDIKAAAEKCHAAGIPLLVDEAHGAHFVHDKLPCSAVRYADMVCQSAHKTLDALTGAAFLHINGKLTDRDRVRRAIRSFESSSPSYPIAASADMARARLETADYDRTDELCRRFYRAVSEELGLGVVRNNDITRGVINFSGYDITGFEAADILSDRYGIDVEMADLYNIVLIITPSNTEDDLGAIYAALGDIIKGTEKRAAKAMITPPPVYTDTLDPAKGWYSGTCRVPLSRAAGRIAATVVTAYPPGTALIVTGERIRNESIRYIEGLRAAGAKLTGICNDEIEVVE